MQSLLYIHMKLYDENLLKTNSIYCTSITHKIEEKIKACYWNTQAKAWGFGAADSIQNIAAGTCRRRSWVPFNVYKIDVSHWKTQAEVRASGAFKTFPSSSAVNKMNLISQQILLSTSNQLSHKDYISEGGMNQTISMTFEQLSFYFIMY